MCWDADYTCVLLQSILYEIPAGRGFLSDESLSFACLPPIGGTRRWAGGRGHSCERGVLREYAARGYTFHQTS
jgi:hypothetical protein